MLPGIHRRADWAVLEETLGSGAEAAAPEGQELARLRLWCDPRQIEPGAERLFATLLPQMASSVHRARLDREAKLDPLTGVPVRRLLDARMQSGVPAGLRGGQADGGDHVRHRLLQEGQRQLGPCRRATKRSSWWPRPSTTSGARSDLCCRYGGEEFTVLLENTDGEDALRLAERLRRAIAALAFSFDRNKIPLTLSLGVASFPELRIKTASELLLLADEALYEAKKRGRNQALLNIGRSAFRAPVTGDASDIMDRPW